MSELSKYLSTNPWESLREDYGTQYTDHLVRMYKTLSRLISKDRLDTLHFTGDDIVLKRKSKVLRRMSEIAQIRMGGLTEDEVKAVDKHLYDTWRSLTLLIMATDPMMAKHMSAVYGDGDSVEIRFLHKL